MPYWVVIPISNNSITPTGAQCDQDFCGVLPRSDPRPAGLVLVWTRTTHIRSEKTQILHEVACTPAPPKTSFGCRKGGCVSAWVDALLVPTNMRAFRVGLGGIRLCSDARCWSKSVVRAPFRTVSPETRALSRESTVVLSAHASRLAYVQSMSSQDRRVYAASGPSHWTARVLLAVRTSSRMQEIK